MEHFRRRGRLVDILSGILHYPSQNEILPVIHQKLCFENIYVSKTYIMTGTIKNATNSVIKIIFKFQIERATTNLINRRSHLQFRFLA